MILSSDTKKILNTCVTVNSNIILNGSTTTWAEETNFTCQHRRGWGRLGHGGFGTHKMWLPCISISSWK